MSNLFEQITRAYQSEPENRTAPAMIGELPLSYEALTPEWMTDILCRGVSGAEVTSITLGAPDSGSANRRKIALTYNEKGQQAGFTRSVFCKASHGLNNRLLLGIGGAIYSETFFYNRIRPQLNIEAPVCFFADYDPVSLNSLIVMDDLTGSVESFCTHETYINKARAESQLDALALLHSKYNETTEFDGETPKPSSWPQYFYNVVAVGMEEAATNGFNAAEEVIPKRLFRRANEIWPATLACVDEHDSLPWTLCHNDVHVKNWYALPGDRMGLSDWQCLTYGHWSRDLAYVLSSSLTVEDRRRWERELIQYYLDKLAAGGLTGISFDFAWTNYRRELLSTLPWWTGTLTPSAQMPKDLQPRDITLEMIRRMTTAIDDLDALDSFK